MIGVFGGTFNPIHFGHLRPALEIVEALPLQQMRLIPAANPPHRETPQVSAELRLRMVSAAIADEPRFVVDERELRRSGPSYSVDTLSSLRQEFGDTPLAMVIGMDAFVDLHTWHRWEELTDMAHLVIMHRPGQDSEQVFRHRLDDAVKTWARRRMAEHTDELHQQRAGKLWVQEVSQLAISSTAIRQMIGAGRSARYLIPDAVLSLIAELHLYQ
jgi:nicotinate-nucleotide adenylyltransferase